MSKYGSCMEVPNQFEMEMIFLFRIQTEFKHTIVCSHCALIGLNEQAMLTDTVVTVLSFGRRNVRRTRLTAALSVAVHCLHTMGKMDGRVVYIYSDPHHWQCASAC